MVSKEELKKIKKSWRKASYGGFLVAMVAGAIQYFSVLHLVLADERTLGGFIILILLVVSVAFIPFSLLYGIVCALVSIYPEKAFGENGR